MQKRRLRLRSKYILEYSDPVAEPALSTPEEVSSTPVTQVVEVPPVTEVTLAPPATEAVEPAPATPQPAPSGVLRVVYIKDGDIWLLGRHRLMCGDSTHSADVGLLMNGKKANLCITDPPYGCDYSGGTGMKIMNDTLKGQAF